MERVEPAADAASSLDALLALDARSRRVAGELVQELAP
jgi:hypothetical protein